VGKVLWLRATDATVALYDDYRHVCTHVRGPRPGQRVTLKEHLPPQAQAFFAHDRQWCVDQAAGVGPSCLALAQRLLSDHIVERLRAAQGLMGLRKTYGPQRLEAACARALVHDSPYYRTVKTILSTGADQQPDVDTHTPSGYAGATRFTRPAAELFPQPPRQLH
jgi:hypothetical protein